MVTYFWTGGPYPYGPTLPEDVFRPATLDIVKALPAASQRQGQACGVGHTTETDPDWRTSQFQVLIKLRDGWDGNTAIFLHFSFPCFVVDMSMLELNSEN
jgi:hypothetical protein